MINWNGKDVEKITDVINIAMTITDPREHDLLIEKVKACGPHAISNIGYFAGYYDIDKANKILRFFNTTHPIFGANWPDTQLTPDELIHKGMEMARRR